MRLRSLNILGNVNILDASGEFDSKDIPQKLQAAFRWCESKLIVAF